MVRTLHSDKVVTPQPRRGPDRLAAATAPVIGTPYTSRHRLSDPLCNSVASLFPTGEMRPQEEREPAVLSADRRVVLISGASRGMGRAVAEHLVSSGFRVSGGMRDPSRLPDGDRVVSCHFDASAMRWLSAEQRVRQPEGDLRELHQNERRDLRLLSITDISTRTAGAGDERTTFQSE